LQQWQDELDERISSTRKRNADQANEDREREVQAKATPNPWERVIDNCEMDPDHYAGDKDVSRMR